MVLAWTVLRITGHQVISESAYKILVTIGQKYLQMVHAKLVLTILEVHQIDYNASKLFANQTHRCFQVATAKHAPITPGRRLIKENVYKTLVHTGKGLTVKGTAKNVPIIQDQHKIDDYVKHTSVISDKYS